MDARITSATVLRDGSLRGQSVREALQMFVDAQLLDVDELGASPKEGSEEEKEARLFSVVESRRLQLDTSKNIIVHFFIERALVACSFDLDEAGEPIPTLAASVRARVLWASRLFKHEFRFRADAAFDDIFEETLTQMVAEGHLTRTHGEGLRPEINEALHDATAGELLSSGPGEAGSSGAHWLGTYRAVLASFLEGYVIAADALRLLLGEGLAEKDWLKQSLALGNRLLLDGVIDRREAISKPVLQNALRSLSEMGFVRSRDGKLHIHEAFQSHQALFEVQSAITGYLNGRHEAKP
jgi:glycerol-3-phosphate O-acyltransferase